MAKIPSIPSVPKNLDQETKRFLEAIKTLLEVRSFDRAGTGERFVTLNELVDGGLAQLTNTRKILPSTSITNPASTTADDNQIITPPQVINLTTDLVIDRIILTWEWPNDDPVDFDYYEVLRYLSTESFSDAVSIGSSQVPIFVDATWPNDGLTYNYAVRAWNQGVSGPATIHQTTRSVDLFAELARVSADNPFEVHNGTTYINAALIRDGAIQSAQIQSLSAEKITVSGTVASPYANIGEVTSGLIRSPDNKFIIDLSNKFIFISS